MLTEEIFASRSRTEIVISNNDININDQRQVCNKLL